MSVVVALIAFSEVCFAKEELVYRDQGDDPNFRNKSTCSDFIRRYRRHLPEAARSISKVDWASRENSGSSKQRALISLPIACRLDGGFSGNHFAGQRIANDDRCQQSAGHVATVFCELAEARRDPIHHGRDASQDLCPRRFGLQSQARCDAPKSVRRYGTCGVRRRNLRHGAKMTLNLDNELPAANQKGGPRGRPPFSVLKDHKTPDLPLRPRQRAVLEVILQNPRGQRGG